MQRTTSPPRAPIHQDSFDTAEFRTPRGSLTTSVMPKKARNLLCKLVYNLQCIPSVQGDHSACAKPPVDFKAKVPFWPGLACPGQAKA